MKEGTLLQIRFKSMNNCYSYYKSEVLAMIKVDKARIESEFGALFSQ